MLEPPDSRIPSLPTLALVAVGLVLVFAVVFRPEPEGLLKWRVEGSRAYGYGYTDSRSVGTIRDLVAEHPEVDTLVLQAMPGTRDVDMNRRIARRIRRESLNTHIPADGVAASGAVDLFLAGVERTAECGARIGVHSWGSALGYDAQDAVRDDQAPRQKALLRELGIDEGFYSFTRDAAGAEDIHFLTREEMERWGVVTEGRECPQ